MPLPWLSNAWGCSPWGAEPGREAAVDTEAFGVPSSNRLQDWLPEPTPVKDIDDWSPADWQAVLIAEWPDVVSLIDPDDQIFATDDDKVAEFLKTVRGTEKTPENIQCFDRADYQLYLAGYRPSGPPAKDDRSILMLREIVDGGQVTDELDLSAMVKAVQYLKDTLEGGVPVMIGLRLKYYDPRPNDRKSTPEIEPTNHFVVAVGAGMDTVGHYVSFFDYLSRYGAHNRLYLRPSMLMESSSGHRTLSEVRVSTAR